MTVTDADLREPPRVSGDDGGTGHLEELRVDPIGLMERVRAECGDVGTFRLADSDVVLLTGPEANEVFFRAPEEELDQAEAYPFMTPVFGEGVVFDASPEERRKALHNQALRDKFMRGHAETIAAEVERMVAQSPDGRRHRPARLVRRADHLHVVRLPHRQARSGSSSTGASPRCSTTSSRAPTPSPTSTRTPDIASFHKRDAARRGLVALVEAIMDDRAAGPPPDKEDRDLLDVLMSIKDEDGSPHFSADIITGMFISMMFAGHHTTSGTAAWTLIELLRHPDYLAEVRRGARRPGRRGPRGELPGPARDAEAGGRHQGGAAAPPAAHPPAAGGQGADIDVDGHRIPAGALVAASPSVSNRDPQAFADAEALRPAAATSTPREDDIANPWSWIPFGAGRHRCVGAAFAMMQLKAIFSVLLREYTFELTQPHDTYRNDHSKMVVQLAQPCAARMSPR